MEIKSFNDILNSMIAKIKNKIPQADTKEGTAIRDIIINPLSDELSLLYLTAQEIQEQQSILTARGIALDNLVGNYFITREGATYAEGYITFIIDTLPTGDILIPVGARVSTGGSIVGSVLYFKTTQEKLVILDVISRYYNPEYGAYLVEVPAICETAGKIGNIAPGAITNLVSSISPFISRVTNRGFFSGGRDEESDNSLILRAKLAFSGLSAGTTDAYLFKILTHELIDDAVVVSAGHPLMKRDYGYGGKVDIYVRGNNYEFVQETYYNVEKEDIIYLKNAPVDRNSIVVYGNGIVITDWIFIKDNSYIGDSYIARDAIKYIGENIITEMLIEYSYDRICRDIQDWIEIVRVVTADVLVKKAKEIKIEIKAQIELFPGYIFENVRENINKRMSDYMATFKLGDKLHISDIIYTIKSIDGVDNVKIKVFKKSTTVEDIVEEYIQLAANEYFNLTVFEVSE